MAKRYQHLKKLLNSVPDGFLVDSKWFLANGIAHETFRDYVTNGWLERIYRGVFRRPAPGCPPTMISSWRTCMLSMQHIMGYDVRVGGLTALIEHGHMHYVPLGGDFTARVYGDDMPRWLTHIKLNTRIHLHSTSLFADKDLGLTDLEPHRWPILSWGWKLRMSTPERAVMEEMDDLDDHASFDHLDKVFQSLDYMCPKLLSALLHSCTKIKVRRLFFVFADRHRFPWREHLDHRDYDLGKGDRALVKDGRMHPKYRIMVPVVMTWPESVDEWILGDDHDSEIPFL